MEDLMSALTEHQEVDGAVTRDELDPRNDREGWPDDVDPTKRISLERFVYNRTPERHRYKTADGEKGIVFFDTRGRAAPCVVTEMDGEELLRLAKSYGKRMKGDAPKFKPSKDPGYAVPDLAEELAELAPGREFGEDEEVRLVEGMKTATYAEFDKAVAKAKWPKPRRMFSGKPDTGRGSMDAFYSDRGTEVASKHVTYKRGKESQVTWMVNADYLKEEDLDEGSAAPGMYVSHAEKVIYAIEVAMPNMRMWAKGAKESDKIVEKAIDFLEKAKTVVSQSITAIKKRP